MGIITKMRNQMQIVMWAILILFVTSMAIGGLVGGASVNDILVVIKTVLKLAH